MRTLAEFRQAVREADISGVRLHVMVKRLYGENALGKSVVYHAINPRSGRDKFRWDTWEMLNGALDRVLLAKGTRTTRTTNGH
jgi:hypothetical protein